MKRNIAIFCTFFVLSSASLNAEDSSAQTEDSLLTENSSAQTENSLLTENSSAQTKDSLLTANSSAQTENSLLTANFSAQTEDSLLTPPQQSKDKLKVWSVDDEIYKNLCALYVREGLSLPSSAGPWSTDEFEKMLNKVSLKSADEISQKLYKKITSSLYENSRFETKDGLYFNINGIFNPEFYLHSNPQNFKKESDWNYDYEKRSEVLAFENELWVSNFIYSYLKLGLTYSANVFEQYNYDADDVLYVPIFNTNIPYLSGNDFSVLSLNFPQRSFFAFGGNHWSLSCGRDVIRWGSGESGNLFLGGNSLFDTNIRFSFYYDSFKYSFVTNFYPHNSAVEQEYLGQNANQTGLRFFMGHRLEFRFFNDKMTLGIAEGLMYQNKSGFADLTIFNPQILWHNLYIRGNANSILCIDFDYTVIKNLNFYTQVLIDEFAVIGEPTASSESGWRPSKIGGLLGVKYFVPVKSGILKLTAEGVYTDPYLYLREKYDSAQGLYGVSFYGDLKEFSSYGGQEIYYLRNCIGYKYGGDCITADFKAVYDSLEKWKSQIEFFYMAHGIVYQDLQTDWLFGKQNFAPSTTDIINSTSGFVEHSFLISLSASYDFFDWLKVYAGADNCIVVNKNNVQSSPVYDFQFYSGAKLKF